MDRDLRWKVTITKRAAKKTKKMPIPALSAFRLLWRDLTIQGPIQPKWPNFSKLKGRPSHWHCHLTKGKPTYVVCWRAYQFSRVEKEITQRKGEIEIFYAWTHEDAPY